MWWTRHQVAVFCAAIALGLALAALFGSGTAWLSLAVSPLLAAVMYTSFLEIPLISVASGLKDKRFVLVLFVTNFVGVPVIAWVATRFVVDDPALLFGAAIVLLTPCIDYVVFFTAAAGGDRARLLAMTPWLMLIQVLLLPAYLWLVVGESALAAVDLAPIVVSFVLIVVVPFVLAAITQALVSRSVTVAKADRLAKSVAVPLAGVMLVAVVASQLAELGNQLASVARLIPIYGAFIVCAGALAIVTVKRSGLAVPAQRSVVMSAITRNSLVVLPIAFALPAPLALAPLAVVTQTLIELIALPVVVALLPTLLPENAADAS